MTTYIVVTDTARTHTQDHTRRIYIYACVCVHVYICDISMNSYNSTMLVVLSQFNSTDCKFEAQQLPISHY